MIGNRSIVNIPPGINKDDNDYTSFIYTDADRIRFRHGLPEKIGGSQSITFGNAQTLTGVARTIFNFTSNNGTEHVLIGTNTRLYSFENGNLYNITPLVATASAVSIPNSLSSYYLTLATDPVFTNVDSQVVLIAYATLTQAQFQVGDTVTISGSSGTINGIPSAQINGVQSITSVSATYIGFVVTATATGTGTGGGASVVLATKLVGVAQAAHGYSNGDRIKIAAATTFASFTIGDLNVEAIIRNVSTNAYDYYLDASTHYATSHLTAQGGASTTVQGQIPGDNCTFQLANGYGGGNYGVGPYGGSPTFGYQLPRIWSIAEYGNTVVLTPGNQTGVYQWLGDVITAPTLLAGSPAAVNWLFVAKNQIVTLGDTDPNRIHTSSSLLSTVWTPSAASDAFSYAVFGADRFIGSGYVQDQNLLFTSAGVWSMTWVGGTQYWDIREVYIGDGALSPHTIVNLPGACIWQGQNDLYIYNGAVVTQVPNNKILRWFLDEMNEAKFYLSFFRKVLEYDEIWCFFPSGQSLDCNAYWIWNYTENTFSVGLMNRTAAEEPSNPAREQYMANGACDASIPTKLYQQEIGFADDGQPITGYLTTNYTLFGDGDFIQNIKEIVPSNLILPSGSSTTELLYSLTVNTKDYDGQVNPRTFGAYDVYQSTTKIDTRINGRQRQYVYNFNNSCGFRIQKTYESIDINNLTVR